MPAIHVFTTRDYRFVIRPFTIPGTLAKGFDVEQWFRWGLIWVNSGQGRWCQTLQEAWRWCAKEQTDAMRRRMASH